MGEIHSQNPFESATSEEDNRPDAFTFEDYKPEPKKEPIEAEPVVAEKVEAPIRKSENDIAHEKQAQDVASALKLQSIADKASQTQNVVTGPRIVLDSERMKQARAIAKSIDLSNSLSIQGIDKNVHGKLSEFNRDILSQAKMSDVSEMSGTISQIIQQARGLDPKSLKESRGIVSTILNRGKNKVAMIKSKFETAEKQFEIIEKKMESDIVRLEADVINIDKLSRINFEQYKELEVLIVAINGCLYSAQTEILPDVSQRALSTNATTADITELMDLQQSIHQLGKKLSDLNELRMDTLQTAQMVKIMKEHGLSLIEHNKGAIHGAIEQWKKGCSIALMLDQQKAAAEMGRAVKDFTNEMKRRNADMLEQNAIVIAENNQRGAVDYETLEYVNNKLISTLDKKYEINIEAEKRRKEEAVKLVDLEKKLKDRVISNNTKQLTNSPDYQNTYQALPKE